MNVSRCNFASVELTKEQLPRQLQLPWTAAHRLQTAADGPLPAGRCRVESAETREFRPLLPSSRRRAISDGRRRPWRKSCSNTEHPTRSAHTCAAMRCSPRALVLFTAAIRSASAQSGATPDVRHGLMCRDDECGSAHHVGDVEEVTADGARVRLCCFHIDGVQHEIINPTTTGATMGPADYPADMQRPLYGETARCGTNRCGCDPGFAGPVCQDIDECALHADNCDPNASCTNTAGSFLCVCEVGFSGDGTACQPVLSGALPAGDPVATPVDATSTSTPMTTAAAEDDTAAQASSPSELSAGAVVLACAISSGVTVAGLWAWSRHAASRHVRARLGTRLADFEHDPEQPSTSLGAMPRGTVWAAISRLTKTLSTASAGTPVARADHPVASPVSTGLAATSSNVDTV